MQERPHFFARGFKCHQSIHFILFRWIISQVLLNHWHFDHVWSDTSSLLPPRSSELTTATVHSSRWNLEAFEHPGHWQSRWSICPLSSLKWNVECTIFFIYLKKLVCEIKKMYVSNFLQGPSWQGCWGCYSNPNIFRFTKYVPISTQKSNFFISTSTPKKF